MKKIITRWSAYIIIAAMLAMLIPGILERVSNETRNNNVTISVLYNEILNKLSKKDVNELLAKYKEIGVNTISVMEEDINSMVSRGDVTSIKYNTLRHKYDDESMRLADMIAEKYPDISYDSHIVIASRDKAKDFLAYMLPRRYSAKEYADIGAFEDLYIYVLHDGKRELYDYAVGYDETEIEQLKNNGFEVALIYKVKNYENQEYQEDIENLVKKYDVQYLNLKENTRDKYKEEEIIKKNYEGLADIINNNNMTLVLTENTNQLSNQKFMGYAQVYNSVMSDRGSRKVMRAFETHDDTQADETNYKYRAEQFLNSTIDRNSRFIMVTQISLEKTSYIDCAEYTFNATKEYKEKAEAEGFIINKGINSFDYTANRKINAALSAVIMIMCVLLMFEMVSGRKYFKLTVSAIVLSVLAFIGTFILPESLVLLYPTVFCAVQSCMAMTSVLYFIKTYKDKINLALLMLGAFATMLLILFAGSVAMGAMLSGMDYYINNLVFRGIKLSLFVPLLYTAAIYYFMFIKDKKTSLIDDVKKALVLDVKVYWIIIGVVVALVGFYYLLRSGNVNSISGLERAMRTAVTELFTERPRTKEFLIGYPALVLLVYYAKHSNIHLIKWLLAVATAILAASITNSFCHVFTGYITIVTRTLNGLILGIPIAAAIYIANLVLIKIIKLINSRTNKNTELG